MTSNERADIGHTDGLNFYFNTTDSQNEIAKQQEIKVKKTL